MFLLKSVAISLENVEILSNFFLKSFFSFVQAMLGFAWAVVAEKMTGLTVLEQVFSPGTTGLVFFLGAVQLFTYASLVPIMNGESTDARSFGPFTAKAERWNGRLAMIGFFSLIVTELYTHTAFFH